MSRAPSSASTAPRRSAAAAAATLLLGALAFAVAAGACTEAKLQKEAPEPPPALDNLLEIEGEFCTEPSGRVAFPVKVLYLIDQSSSLQCTDSMNVRFQALRSSIDELRRNGNARFGFVGFSSWSRGQEFTRDDSAINAFLDPGAGLGPATDYQGALATALSILEQDMLSVGPAERARTRYLINFVSDGVPEPRCLAGCEDTISDCSDGDDNDGDGQRDTSDPDCADIMDNSLHPDNLYAVCNTDQELIVDGEPVYVDMTGVCPEYNQRTQIVQRVRQIIALKDLYGIGDITLNTVLLFSPQDVVEARCPDAGAAFGYDRVQATGMMQSMADAGNGVFRDVNLASGDVDGSLSFEISSITAEKTLTQLFAVNANGRMRAGELRSDMDGDGLDDDLEFAQHTDRLSHDTDDDSYSDLFETRMIREGFDPLDPDAPAVPCEALEENGRPRDGDRDGLTDCEEAFLESDPTLPDTDGDGILDRMELELGTDPVVADGLSDVDFDGVLNLDEIKGYTEPTVPDEQAWRDARVIYDLDDRGLVEVPRDPSDPESRTDERHCYDFRVDRIPLVATPLVDEKGRNRVLLYTSERAARVPGVPGDVRVACFEAYYNGPQFKLPRSGKIDISRDGLASLRQDLEQSFLQLSLCPYFGLDQQGLQDGTVAGIDRGQFEDMVDQCMPPKVQVGQRLIRTDEMMDMLARNIDSDANATIPQNPHELFRPIQNFDPDRHCYRPWEYQILQGFFEAARDVCERCQAP